MDKATTISTRVMQEQKVIGAIHLLTQDHLLRPADIKAIQTLSEVCLAMMVPSKWLE